MAKKSNDGSEKHGKLTASQLLDFLVTPAFEKRWAALGLNDEGDLFDLQVKLCESPRLGPVIKKTNGIRKARYSPPSWNVGKSGALRIIYTHFEKFGFVILLVAYGKSEQADISDAVRKTLNKLVTEAEAELKRRRGS